MYAVFNEKLASLSSAAGLATTFLATRSKKTLRERRRVQGRGGRLAERVQHYFTANGVAEGKKVSVFLSIIGAVW